VGYSGNISRNNLREIFGGIFVGYFENNFCGKMDHYIFMLRSIHKQTFGNEI
jgi:hypothetical protein